MVHKLKKGNRWYDDDADIYTSMELLSELPASIRKIVAQGVIEFVVENTLLGTSDELKSFGHRRVLALIQSKAKRRWYDKDPVLHKAINNILMMADEDRKESAFRLIISLESVEAYKEYCLENDRIYEAEEAEIIVSDIFNRDYDELMDTIKQAGPKRYSPFLKRFIPETSSHVIDQASGMKLSASMFDEEP